MSEMSTAYEMYSAWSKGTVLYTRWADMNHIGYPELMILYTLISGRQLTQKKITEEIGLVKATVNTVIRDLKNRGLVTLTASRNDKRRKYVSLTDEGKIYAEEIIRPLLEMEDRITRMIGNTRMEQTVATMELFNILFEKELQEKTEKENQDP